MSSRGMLEKTAVDRLIKATGSATIVASSKDQVALEGYKNHGVFTYTMIEAIAGKAYGSDNKITISELANYLYEVVPKRTYEKWGYEQVPMQDLKGHNFTIGVR